MKHLAALALASCAACSATPRDATLHAPTRPIATPASAVPAASPTEVALPRAESAAAKEAPSTLVDPLEALPSPALSTSIGSPTNGRLEGGVALPKQGFGFRHNARRPDDARFATGEVIRAIARAAGVVARELPGSELVVNDISLAQGGPIAHHGSHRAGRDADILFYLLGDDAKPTESVGAPLDPEGVGFDFKDLSLADDDVRVRFDAPRTWRFVQALLEDTDARVQRIFVVEHLRAKLLEAAAEAHAPEELLQRFADATCQPSYPHDDHLHVRWYCSAEDLGKGCEDLPPLYPWRESELAALGLSASLTNLVRSKKPAPIVTNEQAEREVVRQRPHADVLAFLKRRKLWEKQPHPGRQYCR